MELFRRQSLRECTQLLPPVPYGELNKTEMKDLLGIHLYEPDVMEVIASSISNYLYLADEETIPSTKFRHFFTELQKIGEKSAFSSAVLASSGDLNMVIKTAAETSQAAVGKESLVHEMFVGICELNKLRKFCMNFTYTYGGLFCSPVLFDKEAEGFCTVPSKEGPGNVPYLLLEHIRGQSLKEFLKSGVTEKQILEVLIQLLLALQIAYEECDFTHFDLHDNNIIVQPRGSYMLLRYREKVVQTQYIAFIIDYGLSHVKHKGVDAYTPAINSARGVDYTKSQPCFDIHLLLGIVAHQLKSDYAHWDLALFLATVLRDLENGVGDPFDFLENSIARERLRLPPDPRLSGLNYPAVIERFIQRYPNLYGLDEPIHLARAYCVDQCESRDEIIKKVIVPREVKDCYDYEEIIDLVNSGYTGKIRFCDKIRDENTKTIRILLDQALTLETKMQGLQGNPSANYRDIALTYFLMAENAYLAFYRDVVGQLFEKRESTFDEVFERLGFRLRIYATLIVKILKTSSAEFGGVRDMARKAEIMANRFHSRRELEELLRRELGPLIP